ncbi:helix-turn-helix domain-containing protein [Aquitalea magnusonii]|uniref:helix-turn-helix domain-containing protein n=1 Tax=Aquitalea magnusonii TaxID=332411 RepID=UPI0007505D4D|nr:helix-turn-helix transcriptional regulator [Aquitalea magnusonii]
METFTDRIIVLRARRRKTITQIAADCGVSRQTASSWFNDGVMPKPHHISLLAESLDTTGSYLVHGDASPARHALVAELRQIIPQLPESKLAALAHVAREFLASIDD